MSFIVIPPHRCLECDSWWESMPVIDHHGRHVDPYGQPCLGLIESAGMEPRAVPECRRPGSTP